MINPTRRGFNERTEPMTRNLPVATMYALAIGLVGIVALVALTDWNALAANALPLAFFAALSFVLKRAGFHAAPEVTHSLVGIIDLAAVLAFGPILGAWVAATSGFFYLFLNAVRRGQHMFRNLALIPIFNAGLKIGMAYASTHLYLLFGGTFAPRLLTPELIVPVLGAALAWFGIDHLGWGLLEFLRGGSGALADFWRRIMFYSVWMELVPLPFAIVIAVEYGAGDYGVLLMITLGLIGTAVVVQRFADTSARLERRRQELTALNEFGQALAQASLDSDQVVQLLHEHVRRIAPSDLCRIEFFDHDRVPQVVLAFVAPATETRYPNESQENLRLLDYFSAHRDSILALDLAKQFVFPLDATEIAVSLGALIRVGARAPRSALIVPLFAGDELIGALSLFSARERAFSAHQERNALFMCAQAAVTIQNARLFAVERKRAAQLATVSEVSRQVAAFLDLDDLLQNVVERIRERFGYSNVHIFTVDATEGYVVFRASAHPRGVEWRARGVRLRIGLEGIVGWVAATGEPLVVDDVTKDARFKLDPDKALADTRSEVAVPLIGGERILGVLDVQSSAPSAFGDEDLFVLKTLAAQVAVALEDARLYNSQREEAYYLNVMLQVAENLSATTDLDEALETVARITPLLVGVARCTVLLYDAAAKEFVPAKAYGFARDLQEKFQQLHFPADNAQAFGRLARSQAPLVIEDALSSESLESEYLKMFGVRSLLMTPLVTRGELVGAMLVDQGGRPTRFTQHEIDVVMGIANQAAVAIASARLAHEADVKKRLDYELGLARQIQQNFLPFACPVIPGYEICSMWQTAREVSGDFYDFIPLANGRMGIIIADVSDKGMAAAMFMALSRTILRTMTIGKQTPREAVERANDVIIADAHSEMFVTVFHAMLDPLNHRLTYVNAGHNPPLLYRATRQELTTVKGHGMALGVMPNIVLEDREIEIERGDVLLMYTDGVTDAINADEEEFGAERLADLVAANAHLGADDLIAEITRAVTEFAGDGVHFDDLTMVALKRT